MRTLLPHEFNPTNDFMRILNFRYSFADVNVNVSYYNSHRFFEVVNYSKPDTNGSNENIISIFFCFWLVRFFIDKNLIWQSKLSP